MRTEQLIADLAARATPVRPLPPPALRTLIWLAAAFATAAAGVAVFGTRADLASVMTRPDFVSAALSALATTTFAVAASLLMAVPAAERSPLLRGGAVAIFVMWALALIVAITSAGQGLAGISDWYVCFVRVIAVALVPGALLVAMLRRAAPLQLGWTGMLALAGATAMGAFSIQFVCPVDDAGHALLGHFGPVLALGAAGVVVAARLLRPRPLV